MDKRTQKLGELLVPNPKLNFFDNSFSNKCTFKMGALIPTAVIQTLPGEKYSLKTESLCRASGLIVPIMDQMEVVNRWFHVTNDVIWPEFPDFITEKTTPVHPYIGGTSTGNWPITSLAHYLGMKPSDGTIDLRMSALPIAAYCKIYDDWFRDDDLQTETFNELVAGSNAANYSAIGQAAPLKVNYQMDYFHKANTELQHGTAIEIPLVGDTDATVSMLAGNTTPIQVLNAATGAAIGTVAQFDTGADSLLQTTGGTDVQLNPQGAWKVDIQAVAQTINALRSAIKTQELLELENRVGSRQVEHTLATWGHRIPDYRAGRSEYIGGSRSPMIISEVLATAEGTSTEVGDYAGHGISIGGGKDLSYQVHDHGILICMSYVIPKTSYQQGLHRMFSKVDRYDYPWLKLGGIGDQAIKVKELYTNTPDQEDDFAYGPKYDEFRSQPNRTYGEFTTTLNEFTLTRIFTSKPAFNADFAEVDSDNHERIFNVTTGADNIWAHFFHKIHRNSPISKYGIPQM